jgi:transposase
MKSWTLPFVFVAACIVCSLAPALGEAGVDAASVLALMACAGSLAVLTASSDGWSRRRARSSRAPQRAGFAPTSSAVACECHRLESIRRLATRHLRSYAMVDNTLKLSYDRDAASEVEGMVALERECCDSLDFRLDRRDSGIELTIVGPTASGPQARWLLSQFLAHRMQLPVDYDVSTPS